MTEHLGPTRERRMSLRSAAGRVERSLSSPTAERARTWSEELARALDVLGEALDTHITVNEAPDGLFRDIIEHAPRLVHRVDKAKGEHEALREAFTRARESVPCDAGGVDDARERTVELLMGLVRHRHLGAELVYEAFNVDLEAAD